MSLSVVRKRAAEMAGLTRPAGAFAVTPHKISVCILLQMYAPSAQMSLPFPFSSVSQHNRLGLYLLSLTKVCILLTPLLFLLNCIILSFSVQFSLGLTQQCRLIFVSFVSRLLYRKLCCCAEFLNCISYSFSPLIFEV